ncbi:MAG: hypothetical protein IPF99_04855 [Deltaproteobacteria bacterium]|nr:hypothetical protein [Deltaproteobacteria bacterium]
MSATSPKADAREQEEGQPDVLGVEHRAEEEEAAVRHVQQHRRVAPDLQPRHQHIDGEQHREDHPAGGVEAPVDIGRVDGGAAAVAPDGASALDDREVDGHDPLL